MHIVDRRLNPGSKSLENRPSCDTLIEGFSHFVTAMTAPIASGWSVAGWDLHPLESAAFARRTPEADDSAP